MPTFPSQIADKFLVRLPDGMRERIAESAKAHQRTMTRDIVARLAASFETPGTGPGIFNADLLPQPVREAIAMEISDNGGTEAEALTRLVLAGQVNGGTFLYATISPRTTFQQFTAMLEAGKKIIPPDAVIVMERGKVAGE